MADDGGPPPAPFQVAATVEPPTHGGLLGLLIRFGLVGLANTAVSFAVIMALEFGLHFSPALANTGGYAVGLVMGFLLSRSFVFRSDTGAAGVLRYLAAFLLAFLLNQAARAGASALLGDAAAMRIAAQLAGMVTYTAFMFVFCRYWVFTRAASASTAGQSASNT